MNTRNLFYALSLFGFLISCGSPSESSSSTEEFSELAKDSNFVDSHSEPESISPDLEGEMKELPIENAESAKYYEVLSARPSNKYLIVIHEWWGLNEHIKTEADRLFKEFEGVNILALDLYDGRVATTREKAMEYMQGADETRILEIVNAVIASLGPDAEVNTIGWCFGGGWSLRTALAAGTKSKACVMYYGMPVMDQNILSELKADVLFIYGTQDEWINTQTANDFEKAMEGANKNLTVEAFDADHAFANPSGDHYLEEAAQDANLKAYFFLKSHMD